MTKEEFNTFIDTPEGKSLIQPIVDRAVTGAIKTYAANHSLPGDEMLERIKMIEQALEVKEAEVQQSKLDFYLYMKCIEGNVPYELLKGYQFSDTRAIDDKVSEFDSFLKKEGLARVNELMSANSPRPQGAGRSTEPDSLSDVKKMSVQELIFREEVGCLGGIG